MLDLQIPLAGMNAASASLDRAATKIALGSASPIDSQPSVDSQISTDTVDLGAEMMALIEAQNDFAANASAVSI